MNPARLDMILRLRQSGISDINVLRAMETIARTGFAPAHYSDMAYEERNLPIDCGQSLPAPLTVAVMAQALELKGAGKVLEIGSGSGYQAAVLSALCTRVYSVERYASLSAQAKTNAGAQGRDNIVFRHGDGRYGWRGQAPFDAILVTAGLKVKPVSLMSQLAPGGRLVCVMNGMLTAYGQGGDVREYFKVTLAPIEAGKSKVM